VTDVQGEGETLFTGIARVERLAWAMPVVTIPVGDAAPTGQHQNLVIDVRQAIHLAIYGHSARIDMWTRN